jgi:hypothetical protein
VLGIVAKTKGQPRSTVGIVLSSIGLVVGIILGAVAYHSQIG